MIIKTTLTIFSAFMLMFLSIFISGLVLFSALKPLSAQEIMPYDVLAENDSLKIILNVEKLGYVSSVTYSYEFAD